MPVRPSAHDRRPRPIELFRDRFLWQFTLAKAFFDPVWYFYSFWFPQYLKTDLGFTLAEIGKTAWIPFCTGGIGNLAGGVVCAWLLKRGLAPGKARRIAVLVFSALMLAAIPVVLVHNPVQSIGFASLATFGYCGAQANVLALPGDLFPANALASVWGLASMGSGFGGMLFSLATGWLVDQYSFRPTFILFGLTPLLAAALIWALPTRVHSNA